MRKIGLWSENEIYPCLQVIENPSGIHKMITKFLKRFLQGYRYKVKK